MSEEEQESSEERYKPSKDLVNTLLKEYPHLDQFMAETLVSLHDHGSLTSIELGWKGEERPEPKHEELVSITTE